MKPIAPLVMLVAALVLLLNITPSWGVTPSCSDPFPCNRTTSDSEDNTAGGTGALVNNNPG